MTNGLEQLHADWLQHVVGGVMDYAAVYNACDSDACRQGVKDQMVHDSQQASQAVGRAQSQLRDVESGMGFNALYGQGGLYRRPRPFLPSR
jgi:hypothetical protein